MILIYQIQLHFFIKFDDRQDGNDVTMMNSSARVEYRLKHMGFIFQFFNLFNELTAIENVMFPMMLNILRKIGFCSLSNP